MPESTTEPIAEPVTEPVTEPVAESTTEPIAEPTAKPATIVNPDGSFSKDWSQKYGEENQSHLSRYKNFDSLVKSHIDTKRKFSKNPDLLVEIPTEKSSDEVKDAWRKALNVPGDISGYEYILSDDMALKFGPLDDNNMKELREFANKKNWNKKDFKDNLDLYYKINSATAERGKVAFDELQAANAEAGQTELRKEWLDDYDSRVSRAQSVMESFGGVDAVAEANLQNSPHMIKFLDNIAKTMSEDTLKGVSKDSTLNTSNIKSQINDLRLEIDKIVKENPINYKTNGKYKELTERKHFLYKQMPV